MLYPSIFLYPPFISLTYFQCFHTRCLSTLSLASVLCLFNPVAVFLTSLCSPLLSLEFSVESATEEFVLLPLIWLVLIFLPQFSRVNELLLTVYQRRIYAASLGGPAVCYLPFTMKWKSMDAAMWFYGPPLLRAMMISCLTGYGTSVPSVFRFGNGKCSYKKLVE